MHLRPRAGPGNGASLAKFWRLAAPLDADLGSMRARGRPTGRRYRPAATFCRFRRVDSILPRPSPRRSRGTLPMGFLGFYAPTLTDFHPDLADPRPLSSSQPRVRKPVGYHSQVQPQHLQAVLPRVCWDIGFVKVSVSEAFPKQTAPSERCWRDWASVARARHRRERPFIETRAGRRLEIGVARSEERAIASDRVPLSRGCSDDPPRPSPHPRRLTITPPTETDVPLRLLRRTTKAPCLCAMLGQASE